jgi:hypothetical protein
MKAVGFFVLPATSGPVFIRERLGMLYKPYFLKI